MAQKVETFTFRSEREAPVAPTDPAVEAFGQQQYRSGDGQCLRAPRTAGSVRVGVDELEVRWPKLEGAARAVDLTDFLATSLFTRSPAGSLNQYSHAVIADTDRSNDIVTVLADYLTYALGELDHLTRHGHAALTLRDAVGGRVDVERAVGVLIGVEEFDSAAAYAYLVAEAERNDISAPDCVRKILASLGHE